MINKWESYAKEELAKSIDYIIDSINGRLTSGVLDEQYLSSCKQSLQESVSKLIDCRKTELNVPRYITGKDIQNMHNEVNSDHPIGYKNALSIKKRCQKAFEKEFGTIELHNDDEIPMSWYEAYYSDEALDPRVKRAKQKDTG